MRTPVELAAELVDAIAGYGRVAVAMSGGVDSAVVAAAAVRAIGNDAVAVTAHSPSVAAIERRDAERTARQIGIRQVVIATGEFDSADYVANRGDRCFHCKSTLYQAMAEWAAASGFDTLANGTNVDDLGDYRPGLRAASDFAVRSPLVECGLTKADVRSVAAHWSLVVADKPASPCLSSRLAVGVQATPERVARVERTEAWLRQRLGPVPLRVRVEAAELARIEVPADRIAEVAALAGLVREFRDAGFRAVTVDLEGFRSGSLNELVPLAMSARESAAGRRG